MPKVIHKKKWTLDMSTFKPNIFDSVFSYLTMMVFLQSPVLLLFIDIDRQDSFFVICFNFVIHDVFRKRKSSLKSRIGKLFSYIISFFVFIFFFNFFSEETDKIPFLYSISKSSFRKPGTAI